MDNLIFKEESYKIVGICREVHNNLGTGFLEIVYKEALEYELKKADIPYEREKMWVHVGSLSGLKPAQTSCGITTHLSAWLLSDS